MARKDTESEGITKAELKTLSDERVLALGECQTQKLIRDAGQKAADKWFEAYVKVLEEMPSTEVVSVLETLIEEGYTCTEQEVDAVLAGTRSSSPSAGVGAAAEASATAEPFTGK